MTTENKWLAHMHKDIPKRAHGNNLSMYAIALEGWRRGLSLKFYITHDEGKQEIRYILSQQGKEHRFEISKGDLVSEEAKKICSDKGLTKTYLDKNGVPVPKGKKFSKGETIDRIVQYADTLGYPVVLKPTNGKLGKGVILGINNDNDLKEALNYVRDKLGYTDILVEQYCSGDDYRLYIVGNKVVGAIKRIPANIVGNGVNSINELIKIKNKERKKNPNLSTRLIQIDEDIINNIKKQGYTLESQLEKGKVLYLREKGNISSGGDPIDVTDNLTHEIENIVINTAKSIPGFVHGGIDIIINKQNNLAVVLEANVRAGIGSHLYPMQGLSQDIPKEIIDFYFPDSSYVTNGNMYYFDFKKITDLLRSGMVSDYELPTITNNKQTVETFEAYGDVQTKKFKEWVQKQAVNLMLDGYIENSQNGNVSIVVLGKKRNVKKFREILKANCPLKANTINNEVQYLNIGFEIK